MAMSVCMRCIKYLVFIFNFLFWIAGMGVLVTAMYLRFDPGVQRLFEATDRALEELFFGSYILMGVGFLMAFVGFLGCCGAYQESQWLLASFFACLVIILGGEVAGIVWAYINKDEIKTKVDDVLRTTVQKDYNVSDPKTVAFDWLQGRLECCGANGPADWACSKWARTDLGKCDIGIKGQTSPLNVPTSCCTEENRGLFKEACVADQQGLLGPAIYQTGCSEKLEKFFQNNLTIVIGVGVGLLAIEVLGMIFAIVMCCNLRRSDDDHYSKP